MASIISANRLSDGLVVFFRTEGGWTETFEGCAVYADAAALKAALVQAQASEAEDEVVEPYGVVVELRNGHYTPKVLRESIRAFGPTTRLDLGKQAEGIAPIAAQHAP